MSTPVTARVMDKDPTGLWAHRIPLALYVHLPWCERKCPYCDFNSHALTGQIPEEDYLQALEADLSDEARYSSDRSVSSIFIGGGTPSLFSARAIGRILEAVDRDLGLAPEAEITLEANPGSSEAARFADYRAAGVNRLSIGVQSFDDRCLEALGRVHSADEARRAIRAAQEAGFERLNADLMFGLPGQELQGAVRDVRTALDCGIDHLSHYELTLEPNTVFYARPPKLPDEDRRWAMQQVCAEQMTQAGLHRYEISAWAAPGQACRHNLNYWRFGDYAAIGAGAHGKLTLADGGIWRHHKHRIPERYMSLAGAPARVSWRELGPDERCFEFMLNALRLTEGLSEALFTERTGLGASHIRPRLETMVAEGLMEQRPEGDDFGWRPTNRGLDLLNEMQARFLPEGS